MAPFRDHHTLVLILVVCGVGQVAGLICQFPHCESVACEPVGQCNGTVKLGGGYCGCCVAGFIYLGRYDCYLVI